jgi:hypothetical protein
MSDAQSRSVTLENVGIVENRRSRNPFSHNFICVLKLQVLINGKASSNNGCGGMMSSNNLRVIES